MPRLAFDPVSATPGSPVDRCIVVPVARPPDGQFFAPCVEDAFLGVMCDKPDAEACAERLSTSLACGPSPTHTLSLQNVLGGLDLVYAVASPPFVAPPIGQNTQWLTASAVPPTLGSYAIRHCLTRIAQRTLEGAPPDAVLGAFGPPVPLVVICVV